MVVQEKGEREMLDMKVAREAIRIKNAMQAYNDENPRYTSNRHYCEHGTYIGTWWGPDHLCGYCEDGISLYEYALGIAREQKEEKEKAAVRTLAYDMMDKIKDMDGYDDISEEANKDLWLALAKWAYKHN